MSDIEYTVTRDDAACKWRLEGNLKLRFETAMTDEEIRSADDWQRVLEERKDGIRRILWNAAMNEFRDMEEPNEPA